MGVRKMKLARNVIVLDLRTTSMLSPTHPYYLKRRGFATSQAKVPQISLLKELYLLTEILPTHFLFR